MLKLNNITKKYKVGDMTVEALKGVSVEFRENEFVSVLGPSGCGKTTLLNIVGGLDQYTSGDLIINDKSTKEYKDSDWDTYRNHRIGFVFQSYNLISHQTVLSNVELALTLSGVGKSERRKRAMDALNRVGLSDQYHKRPNQMSGGQMQRVAIARALVNNPDILLADEPTGALDSETSVQIMNILKEISKEKLVVMVTHNPELAEKYSTRIIRLLDGSVIDDTNPYTAAKIEPLPKEAGKKEKKDKSVKKTSMSFFTALSLSLNNLMTKKARTIMTAFAGSIGIIGIALILAISSGVNEYVKHVQADTLSSYPLTIEAATMDMSGIMAAMMTPQKDDINHDSDKIYSNDIMTKMMQTMSSQMIINDLKTFKKFVEDPNNGISDLVSDIKYGYSTTLNIYKADTSNGVLKVNPSQVFESMGMSGMMGSSSGMGSMMTSNFNVWTELMNNKDLLDTQYDVVYGKMPESFDEAVIIVDKNNEISDYTLYALGIKDPAELKQMMKDIMDGKKIDETTSSSNYSYEYLCSLKYKLLLNTDYYSYDETSSKWTDRTSDQEYIKGVINDETRGVEVKIVGILRQADNSASNTSGAVAYRSDLMTTLLSKVNDSEIVKDQKEHPDIDVFTGRKFTSGSDPSSPAAFDVSMLTAEEQAYFMTLSDTEKAAFAQQYMEKQGGADTSNATYEDNLDKMGVANIEEPAKINIYPKDFQSKEKIVTKIEEYNNGKSDEEKIQYTDYISIMMSSITMIINAISYILIAFVAISLIVSSIMIGIITYISVLERTKEIGILRSIGASKRDISRVFNAETLIVGFVAGIIGIGITLLLTIPINLIISALTGISGMAVLPWVGAVILILISMLLTFIAGLIPSRFAAKKDPVEALRTE